MSAKRVAALWVRRKMGQSLWMDRERSPKGVRYPKSKWDKIGIFGWATPAKNIDGSFPEPWRVSHSDLAETWLKRQFKQADLYTDHHSKVRGKEALWVGLRDNRDKSAHFTRMGMIALGLKRLGLPYKMARDNSHILLLDDLDRDVLR